jgi:hypothetical protein
VLTTLPQWAGGLFPEGHLFTACNAINPRRSGDDNYPKCDCLPDSDQAKQLLMLYVPLIPAHSLYPLSHTRSESTRQFQYSLKRIQSLWLSDEFYELLPYLYSIGGVITISYTDSPIGYASGCLLSLTGGVIFLMRRDYRHGRDGKKN